MKTGNFWPPKFFFQIWLKIQPKTFKTSKFHEIWAKKQGCAPLSFISWKKSIFEKSELQRAAKPKPLDISGKNFGFRVHSLVFQHRSTKKTFLETPVYPLCKDFSDSYLQLLLIFPTTYATNCRKNRSLISRTPVSQHDHGTMGYQNNAISKSLRQNDSINNGPCIERELGGPNWPIFGKANLFFSTCTAISY